MCSGTEAGSYLRLIDSCITQLNAQGPSMTCNESKEEVQKIRGSRREGFGNKGLMYGEYVRVKGLACIPAVTASARLANTPAAT